MVVSIWCPEMTHCGGSALRAEDPAAEEGEWVWWSWPYFLEPQLIIGMQCGDSKGNSTWMFELYLRTQTLSQPGTWTACIIETKYISTHILKCDHAF